LSQEWTNAIINVRKEAVGVCTISSLRNKPFRNRHTTGSLLLTEDYLLKNPRNDTKRFSRAINKDSFSYLLIASPPHKGWEGTDDINASRSPLYQISFLNSI